MLSLDLVVKAQTLEKLLNTLSFSSVVETVSLCNPVEALTLELVVKVQSLDTLLKTLSLSKLGNTLSQG